MAGANRVQIDGYVYPILPGLQNYEVIDQPYVNDTLHEGTGGPTRPATESAVTWTALHRGTGQAVYDPRQPARYKRARNYDLRYPGFMFHCGEIVTTSGVAAAPTKMLQWGDGFLYIAAGRYLYRTDFSTAPTEVLDVGANNTITDILDASNDLSSGASSRLRLMVCVAGAAFQYSANGTSWTQSNRTTANGGQPRYGLRIRDTLYLFYRANEMRSAGVGSAIDVDNAGTAFGAVTYIGSGRWNINGVTSYRERLIVKKDDGLYTVDRDAAVRQVTGGLSGQIDTSTLIAAEWAGDGLLYFKWGSKLYAYDGQDIVATMGVTPRFAAVGPERTTGVDEDHSAEVTALLATDRWLWASVENNASTREDRLMCYGYTDADGPPVWHDMNVLSGNCDALGWLAQSGSNNPRLYFGAGSSASYIIQPVTDFPLDDPNYRFCAAAEVYLPDHHGLGAGWRKNYLSVASLADNLSNADGRYIDVHYVLNHSGNPQDTAVGRLLSNDPIFFDADTTARHIEISLHSYTGVNTSCPVLQSFTLEYDHEPPPQIYHSFYVVLSDTAQATGSSGRSRLGRLQALRERGGQVAFRDGLEGDTWRAKLERLGAYQERRKPGGETASLVLPLLMKLYRGLRLRAYYYGSSFYGTATYS